MNLNHIRVNDFESNGWRFEFTKSIISASHEIDHMQSELNLQAIPDVVFGNNTCNL